MFQRPGRSGDQVEEEDPEAERNVVGALQGGHLTQDHQRVPDGVAEVPRHHSRHKRFNNPGLGAGSGHL